MPIDFVKCTKNGRVRRFSGPNKKLHLKADEWVNVCWDKRGSHRGETHKKKKVAHWVKSAK